MVASFNPETVTIYVREEISELTLFHEMAHMKQYKSLGKEAYQAQTEIQQEMYVWEQIVKSRAKMNWTDEEIKSSLDYLNEKLSNSGSNPINLKEELKRLNL